MLDLSLGYQVLLQPAAMVFALGFAVWRLLQGFSREEVQRTDGLSYRVTRWQLQHTKQIALVGLGAVVFVLSTVVVPFGHRGVVWSAAGGVDSTERIPGLSFILPIVQSDVVMDVREQRYVTVFPEGHEKAGEASAFVQTSDLQEVALKVSVVYAPDPNGAAELYNEVGPNYVNAVVEPLLFDAIKEAAGQCLPNDDGICQRRALSFAQELGSLADDIRAIVEPQLEQRRIRVVSLAVEDAIFDEQFIQAVKDKVIADEEAAEQERLVAAEAAKKRQVILQAEAAEQKKLIEARGEESAIQSIARALGFSPQEYLDWLLLTRWDGALPDTLVGDSGEFGVLLDVAPRAATE